MCRMFDNNEHTVVILSDVDAEIDRLLMSSPPQVAEAARIGARDTGSRTEQMAA